MRRTAVVLFLLAATLFLVPTGTIHQNEAPPRPLPDTAGCVKFVPMTDLCIERAL